MFEYFRDLFGRIFDVFRGSIGNEVTRHLIHLQRERALAIAQAFATDVYVFDQSGFFHGSETRRQETIYYNFKDGKYGLLEPAIQLSMKNTTQYVRFVDGVVEQDCIGVFVPFEVCFIKSKSIRDMVMAGPRPMESRIEAMKKIVENYDRIHSTAPEAANDESTVSLLSKLAHKF